MQLPVLPTRQPLPPDTLGRAVRRADIMACRMIAEETDVDGATVFHNAARPAVHMANCAVDLRLDSTDTPDALVDRIASHFGRVGTVCEFLYCADADWPAALAQVIEQRGYQRHESGLYALDTFNPPATINEALQVIPARAAYGEMRRLIEDEAVSRYQMGGATLAQFVDAGIDILDEPRFEALLGRLDHQPAGFVRVATVGQIGVIDMIYTASHRRRLGVASTLMLRAYEYCRRAQFEHVILECVDADLAQWYESLGFQRIGTNAGYRRRTD